MNKEKTLKRLKETAEIKPNNEREIGFQVGIKEAIDLIEKMQEGNKLTQNWINTHLTDGHNVQMGEKVIYVEDLEDLFKEEKDETERN